MLLVTSCSHTIAPQMKPIHPNRRGIQDYKLAPNSNKLFYFDSHCTELPSATHPIVATANTHDDADELYTMYPYNLIHKAPPSTPTILQTIKAIDAPPMAGSDGSVTILNGERACSYCIQYNGIRYGGSRRYPPSDYATSYRSELEGGWLTLLLLNEMD